MLSSRRLVVALALSTPLRSILANTGAGLTAVIADFAEGGGPGGGTFFMVTEVDGQELTETALEASRRASAGLGPYMVVRAAERAVPAGTVRLSLRGIQTHVAPIDTFFRTIFRGGRPEVTGTVTVSLAAEHRYRVVGVLDGFRREAWLEDEQGLEVPGSRVAVQPDPELVRQMEGSAFVATNLRYEGDWINEVPLPQQPFVPVGCRLKVIDYGTYRASVLIDGRKMRMGVDYTRGIETIQQFVARSTTPTDPRAMIAAYPEKVRNAIRAAKVFAGMTREQVLYSLGRPRVDYVPDLAAGEWKYQVPEQEEMFLVFDDSAVLKEIDASRRARRMVLYELV